MSTSGLGGVGGAGVAAWDSLSGDPAAEIAALALGASSEQRRIAHQTRDAEEKVEDVEENAQVAEMHRKGSAMRDAADADMMAGVVGGIGAIAGGALGLDGGVEVGKIAEGAGRVGAASFTGVAGHERAAGQDDDAIAAQHEHAASRAKNAAAEARDDAKEANEAASKALDFLKGYDEGRAGANSAALHRA